MSRETTAEAARLVSGAIVEGCVRDAAMQGLIQFVSGDGAPKHTVLVLKVISERLRTGSSLSCLNHLVIIHKLLCYASSPGYLRVVGHEKNIKLLFTSVTDRRHHKLEDQLGPLVYAYTTFVRARTALNTRLGFDLTRTAFEDALKSRQIPAEPVQLRMVATLCLNCLTTMAHCPFRKDGVLTNRGALVAFLQCFIETEPIYQALFRSLEILFASLFRLPPSEVTHLGRVYTVYTNMYPHLDVLLQFARDLPALKSHPREIPQLAAISRKDDVVSIFQQYAQVASGVTSLADAPAAIKTQLVQLRSQWPKKAQEQLGGLQRGEAGADGELVSGIGDLAEGDAAGAGGGGGEAWGPFGGGGADGALLPEQNLDATPFDKRADAAKDASGNLFLDPLGQTTFGTVAEHALGIGRVTTTGGSDDIFGVQSGAAGGAAGGIMTDPFGAVTIDQQRAHEARIKRSGQIEELKRFVLQPTGPVMAIPNAITGATAGGHAISTAPSMASTDAAATARATAQIYGGGGAPGVGAVPGMPPSVGYPGYGTVPGMIPGGEYPMYGPMPGMYNPAEAAGLGAGTGAAADAIISHFAPDVTGASALSSAGPGVLHAPSATMGTSVRGSGAQYAGNEPPGTVTEAATRSPQQIKRQFDQLLSTS